MAARHPAPRDLGSGCERSRRATWQRSRCRRRARRHCRPLDHTTTLTGDQLPHLVTPIPGPRSQQLADRLRRVESRNITATEPVVPIFWDAAHGANVRDVDGNIYVDLTSGFGVANAGHSNEAVARAIAEQSAQLAHALGDVYPAEIKVRLLERIAAIMPQGLDVTIL